MAINFGQQINQALGQSLSRVDDSRARAQQLAQRLQEQQFEQQMQQQVQQLRQREQQLAEEAQTEKIMNDVFQRSLQREKEDRLKEYSDAQIANMGNDGGQGGGDSDYLKVTEVQTNNKQIEQLSSKLQDINERISQSSQLIDQTANQEGVNMQEAMSDPSVRQAGQQKLTLQAKKEQLQEQIQDLRKRNEKLFGGNNQTNQQPSQQQPQPQGQTQQQPSREDLPQVTTREEFNQLESGALFIGPDGQVKRKR